MKAVGTFLLNMLAKFGKVLLRLALFIIGSLVKILGATIVKVGDELIALGK